MLRKYQGENLRSDWTLHIRSLPHNLVKGGIPHADSRHRGVHRQLHLPSPLTRYCKTVGVGSTFTLGDGRASGDFDVSSRAGVGGAGGKGSQTNRTRSACVNTGV